MLNKTHDTPGGFPSTILSARQQLAVMVRVAVIAPRLSVVHTILLTVLTS